MLKTTQKLTITLALSLVCVPTYSMQRAACMLREANLPWKLCLAQLAANTAAEVLVKKAWQYHPEKPKTFADEQKILHKGSADFTTGKLKTEDQQLKFIKDFGPVVLAELVAIVTYNYFDQKILSLDSSQKLSKKHRLAQFVYSNFGNFLLRNARDYLAASKVRPQFKKAGYLGLKAASMTQDYFAPAAIDTYFTGKARRTPAMRFMYIAQRRIPNYLVEKLTA